MTDRCETCGLDWIKCRSIHHLPRESWLEIAHVNGHNIEFVYRPTRCLIEARIDDIRRPMLLTYLGLEIGGLKNLMRQLKRYTRNIKLSRQPCPVCKATPDKERG
jgi:hypothetical protein